MISNFLYKIYGVEHFSLIDSTLKIKMDKMSGLLKILRAIQFHFDSRIQHQKLHKRNNQYYMNRFFIVD